MKSKTYQKEGWFILEEENSVFGFDAENTDELDSEKNAIFIIENKEEILNKTEVSSKALTDFFDSVTDDLPEPSEEEIDSGIAKILERTHPKAVKAEPSKTTKSKKVTFRVLFIAALLSVLSFTCLVAVGSRHNISIENGFATFAKDTVKVVFYDETEEEYIDIKSLLEDLSSHGFENILIPEALYNYKSSQPQYFKGLEGNGSNGYVIFELNDGDFLYDFKIDDISYGETKSRYYVGLDNMETVEINGICMYLFEFDTNDTAINFVCDEYSYYITSKVSPSEMINIAQTIVVEE